MSQLITPGGGGNPQPAVENKVINVLIPDTSTNFDVIFKLPNKDINISKVVGLLSEVDNMDIEVQYGATYDDTEPIVDTLTFNNERYYENDISLQIPANYWMRVVITTQTVEQRSAVVAIHYE